MNTIQKILMGMGVFYIALGGVGTIVCGVAISQVGLFIALPLLFLVLGIAFVTGVMMSLSIRENTVLIPNLSETRNA